MKFQFTNYGACPVVIQYVKRDKDYSDEDHPYSTKEVDIDETVLLHSVQEIVSIVPESPSDDEDDGPDNDDDLDDEGEDSGESEDDDDDSDSDDSDDF